MNGLPRRMKSYPIQFSRFSYYKHLQIVHMFDTMHIKNNTTKLLWKILDGRTDKERIGNICSDIQEANHALQSVIINSNGDGREQNISLPWLLIEQQSLVVKEVIRKIRFLMGFSSNIQNILMKKGDFGGVKTHEWNTFIKVIIRYINILVYFFLVFFFSNLEININDFFCYNMFYLYLSQTTLTTT
jgi:hypothetical protein